MGTKIVVNGEEVFSTQKSVSSTKITGSNGHIAEVSGDVDTILITVKENDGLNVTLDEVDRQTRQAPITEKTVEAEEAEQTEDGQDSGGSSEGSSEATEETPKKSSKKASKK